MLGDVLKLLYMYEGDQINHRPFFLDRGFLAAAVAFGASIYAKYMGVQIDPDLQVAIVTVIAGIAHLTQSHVGFVAKPDPATEAKQVAKDVQQHNLTNMS